jgi:SAM-dependent methyltransferase
MLRAAKHRAWLARRRVDAAAARLPLLSAKERVYDDWFFEDTDSAHHAMYERLARSIHERLGPATAVDVGCGTGFILAELAARGVEVRGVEGSRHAIERSPIADRIVRANLERGVPELGRFDLAICIEVAEHLPERAARPLVAGLARLSDRVVFTAATPGQGGTHHVNEQPRAYWERLFAEHDLAAADETLASLRADIAEIPEPRWMHANLAVFERAR